MSLRRRFIALMDRMDHLPLWGDMLMVLCIAFGVIALMVLLAGIWPQ